MVLGKRKEQTRNKKRQNDDQKKKGQKSERKKKEKGKQESKACTCMGAVVKSHYEDDDGFDAMVHLGFFAK